MESKKVNCSKYIKYRKKWESDPKLKDWIAPIPGNHKAAYCKLCHIQLHQWCTRDLYKHACTLKHQQYKVLANMNVTLNVPACEEYFRLRSNNSCKDTRITTIDGDDRVTINIVDIDEKNISVDAKSEDDDSICEKYKDWLEINGSYARCTACNIKIKSSKLDLFKHNIGKWHCKKLAKKMNKRRRTSTTTIDHFSFEMGEISFRTKKIINLRNDNITTPSKAMREVMKKAILGDDHFQSDENVINLQRKVANLLQKECGLLFPSTTMANLVAVISQCWNRDSEVVMGDCSQLYVNSNESLGKFGRTPTKVIANLGDGTLCLEELEEILTSNSEGEYPITTVVCIENAHTLKGGRVLPIEWLRKLRHLCDRFQAFVHMDGTRFMNAALTYEEEPHFTADYCDVISFCLDTGLGAPIGTVLAGSFDFIERAREIRQMFGGTLHQIGMSAAAGIYALEKINVDRLLHDHRAAKRIAQCVYDMEDSAIIVTLDEVETNIVHLYTDNIRLSAEMLCERLSDISTDEVAKLEGSRVSILATPLHKNVVQLMTHMDLSLMDVELIVMKITLIIEEYIADMELYP